MRRAGIAAAAALAVLVLAGCGGETPAEAAFLNEVHAVAKAEGVDWTLDTQNAVKQLGENACADLAEGATVEQLRVTVRVDDEQASAVAVATVDAAAEHLCGVS
jgi:hypothetical protein